MTVPSLTSLLIGKQYIGIEHFSFKNEEKTAILLIEKKKGELVITTKDKISYSGKLAEKWNKKLPFFLVINTTQVIQKEINTIDTSDEKLLHKAFPNTNWDEFYFEIWRLKTKSIIIISRKSYINALLSDYHQQGVFISGISLGIGALSEIMNYTQGIELLTNHQIISSNEDSQIIQIASADLKKTYNINGLEIKNVHLLTFGGILRFLLDTTANTGNIISYSQALYENFQQQSFFSKGIKLMVGILLTVLLINFFVFSHYYTLVQETEESLLLNKSSLEEITKTKQRILLKEQKAKTVIASTISQSSLFINEITKRTPQSILLSELIYHPLEKKIKEEESIVIQEKTITLSGTTVNNDAFTHWIEEIEKLKWIDQVIITHFGKNDLSETEFSIKITLK
jgi:Tfp pilus assembly protein PilN